MKILCALLFFCTKRQIDSADHLNCRFPRLIVVSTVNFIGARDIEVLELILPGKLSTLVAVGSFITPTRRVTTFSSIHMEKTHSLSRLGGVLHLACERNQEKKKEDCMKRLVTSLRWGTSPTQGPPPPCEQALSYRRPDHLVCGGPKKRGAWGELRTANLGPPQTRKLARLST